MEIYRGEMAAELGDVMKGFVDSALGFYEGLKERPVFSEADEETVARLRGRGIPESGRPLREVFEEMMRDVYANQSLVQHPRCFACVPSPVSLYSWMGDVMTNAFDPHAGSWINASGAGCVEQEVIRWMRAGRVSGGQRRPVRVRRLHGEPDGSHRRQGPETHLRGAGPGGGLRVGTDPFFRGQGTAHHRIPPRSGAQGAHGPGVSHGYEGPAAGSG